MRWIVAGVLTLLAGWAAYVASPYIALYRLGLAVEDRNVAEVAARVNVRALRVSLAKQIAAELSAADPGLGGLSSQDAQLAAAAALALAEPVLSDLVTPEGVIRVLSPPMQQPETRSVFGASRFDLDDLDDFLAASSWRGFRTIYFVLPPGEPPETRYRVQLRIGGLRWRVIGIDLPPAFRARIVAELRRRRP